MRFTATLFLTALALAAFGAASVSAPVAEARSQICWYPNGVPVPPPPCNDVIELSPHEECLLRKAISKRKRASYRCYVNRGHIAE